MVDIKKVREALNKKKDSLKKRSNVVGVAAGYKISKGKRTKDLAVVVFVKSKVEASTLTRSQSIPKTIDGIPTDVVETGEIKALVTGSALDDPKSKFRPAPGGVSVGHYSITAGTLGKWVKYGGVYHILSNNHVLANSNDASIGDNIIQQGKYDGGTNPYDKIAELADFIPINFNGTNLVDVALAKVEDGEKPNLPIEPDEPSDCWVAKIFTAYANFVAKIFNRQTRLQAVIPSKIGARAIDEYVDGSILNIGIPNGIIEGEVGMDIKKMGRTTGLTHGEILYTDATIDVSYGESGIATFVDQLISGDMSAGGDSGSIIVTEDGIKIVGLLFAGSDTHTIFNRIQNVINCYPGIELI